MIEAAANSLIIAIAATALATILRNARGLRALEARFSGWISGSLYLSLVTPEIVTGVSLLAFFQWSLPLPAPAAGHAHRDPGACRLFSGLRRGGGAGAAAHFDPALEEAALDLGATEFTAFRTVTLPYLAPAIAAAAMLAFTVSIDDYVITSLVAGVDSQTLPMVIYALARRGVSPMLNAVSTIIVAGLGMLVLVSERLRAK